MISNYKNVIQARKAHLGELADSEPDPKAQERFRAPAYQAGRLIRAQIGADKVKWGDLVDYMIQGVTDGSIRLSDPIPGDGHIDIVEYLSGIINIKEGVRDNAKCKANE